jgi:hypothetical protein
VGDWCPILYPAEARREVARSLSLIRKSLTTAGWEHIAVYSDDVWLTVPLNASFRPGGRLRRDEARRIAVRPSRAITCTYTSGPLQRPALGPPSRARSAVVRVDEDDATFSERALYPSRVLAFTVPRARSALPRAVTLRLLGEAAHAAAKSLPREKTW